MLSTHAPPQETKTDKVVRFSRLVYGRAASSTGQIGAKFGYERCKSKFIKLCRDFDQIIEHIKLWWILTTISALDHFVIP